MNASGSGPYLAAQFGASVKIVTMMLDLRIRGGQQQLFHVTIANWSAPSVGPVRTVQEVQESGERTISELVSMMPEACTPGPVRSDRPLA